MSKKLDPLAFVKKAEPPKPQPGYVLIGSVEYFKHPNSSKPDVRIGSKNIHRLKDEKALDLLIESMKASIVNAHQLGGIEIRVRIAREWVADLNAVAD